jgi:hypothetical protein
MINKKPLFASFIFTHTRILVIGCAPSRINLMETNDIMSENTKKEQAENDIAYGNACIAGDIHIIDDPDAQGGDSKPEKITYALVIQFDSAEEVRKALKDQECSFSVFGC